MFEFQKDQIFIVTGASSGIGRGVAWSLIENGATVIGIGRREDKLLETKEKSKSPENFHAEIKDLSSDFNELPKYISMLREKYGKFQGMLCSAGISEHMSLKGMYLETLEKTFATNYFSPIMLAKGLADRRNNVGKGTSIVSISSIAAHTSPPGMTAYAGSKAALAASMRVISRELASMSIRVNTISPAIIETPMLDAEARAFNEGKYPFGFGEVSDAANLILFLLSARSKWITGQDYIVDCGSF